MCLKNWKIGTLKQSGTVILYHKNMKIKIEKLFRDVSTCDMRYIPVEGTNGNKLSDRGICGLGHSHICAVCGEEFEMFSPTLYAYKIREYKSTKIFCSWGCMCKYRKEKESSEKRRKKS